MPNIRSNCSPFRLEEEHLRGVFDLLAEIKRLGDQPFVWRAKALAGLKQNVEAAGCWMLHQHRSATSDRMMLLGSENNSELVKRYRCTGHKHTPIPRIFRGGRHIDSLQHHCEITTQLRALNKTSHRLTTSVPLSCSTQRMAITLTRPIASETFLPLHRQVLRLFAVELAHVVRRDRDTPPSDPLQAFSPRLRDVLRLIAEGKSEPQAAAILGISRHTVHQHLMTIYRKLDVSSRVEFLAVVAKMPRLYPLPTLNLKWPTAAEVENDVNE